MGVREGETKPPESPDEQPKSGENFPNPDLNPMTNPVLEKNLGRWAQVYYTSPPEKREQAVQELLRELVKVPEETAEKNPARNASERVPAGTPHQEGLICPACLHKNEGRDRFCGLCGFPLETEKPVANEVAQAVPAPPPIDRTENGWQWLREKNLQALARSQKRASSRIALLTVLVLLALAAASWLLWQNRFELSGHSSPASSQPAVSPSKSETHPAAADKPARPELPAAQLAAPESKTVTATAAPERTASAPEVGASRTSALESGTVGEGTQELTQGRRYLEGQGVPKNTAIAATWLWKSVAKQNVDAVLLLSDLYVRGDGVPQSCDQARVLLRAAAQKGSAQARNKLSSLQRSGCR
jgi:hypothetical protein